MADYISREVICESYIHFEVDDADITAAKEAIRKQLQQYFDVRAKFLFGNEIKIEISIEDGSVKAKIGAYGMLVLLLGPITNYADFKASIKEISADAESLAKATNLESRFINRGLNCERIRFEARTGVLGRVQDLVTRMDTLKKNLEEFSVPRSAEQIEDFSKLVASFLKLKEQAGNLLQKIENDDDRKCLAAGLEKGVRELPKEAPFLAKLKRDSLGKQLLASQSNSGVRVSELATTYASSREGFIDFLKSTQ